MSSVEIRKVKNEKELKAAFDVRRDVYIIEQNIREEEEFDEYDDDCIHFIALIDSEIGGTARWRMTDDGAKLERFAVLKEYRRMGVASKLVETVISDASLVSNILYLNAQNNIIDLYKKFGFLAVGNEFEECGIKHIKMVLKLK